jgi:hypothetical protein
VREGAIGRIMGRRVLVRLMNLRVITVVVMGVIFKKMSVSLSLMVRKMGYL